MTQENNIDAALSTENASAFKSGQEDFIQQGASDKSDEVLIAVKDLKKSFGDNEVLKGINLNIKNGEKIAVIGPSGCGKSTLLRCINCMEDPSSGSIFSKARTLPT